MGRDGVLIGNHCSYLYPSDDVEEEEQDGVDDGEDNGTIH